MPNLDLRFDDYTEQYAARQLAEAREFAQTTPLPDDLMVEIGSNRGRFLLELARGNPDQFVLGIEIRGKYARLSRRDLDRAEVRNAAVLCCDATLAFPIAIDDEQVSDVFMLYPDPWWKKKHRKRRVVRDEFLDTLHRKMKPGAHLWIRTDVGPLADDMRDVLMEHGGFEPVPPGEFPREPFPRSTRERKWIADGNPVNLVYFKRL